MIGSKLTGNCSPPGSRVIFACPVGNVLGQYKPASLCCFAILAPFSGFVVCPKLGFRYRIIFVNVLTFPLRFFLTCSIFLIPNSVLVFVVFFLLWFLFCCFAVFALLFFPLLCLGLVFVSSKFSPGALRFSCVNFVFLVSVSSALLLCCCVCICRFVFGVSCTRLHLLLCFSFLCVFCVFSLTLNVPNLCPTCPPVDITTIGSSRFAVSFFFICMCES